MRRLALASIGITALLTSGSARAAGGSAWLAASGTKPLEQRIAVASSPDRTTIWTSVSLSSTATSGLIGVVVPAPAGTSVDVSTDAWLEALEVATAPRVLPPANASLICPGDTSTPKTYAVAGDIGHVASADSDVELLADEAAVEAWAATNGLTVSPSVAVKLNASGAAGFVAMKIAVSSKALTPTLRLVMPGAPAVLPLALTSAASNEDLLVTTWVVGNGRAALSGSSKVIFSSGLLSWNAKTQATNYEDTRHDLLFTGGVSGSLVESSSHQDFAHDTSLAGGTAAIDDVLRTYFERAAAYDATTDDPDACAQVAASSIESTSAVASACPRAALGVVGGASECVDGTVGVSPSIFRCGSGADDVAVALSGLAPASAWLTRTSLLVPAGESGLDFTLAFSAGGAIDPIFTAASVDLGDCNQGASTTVSTSVTSTGAFGTSGTGTGSGGPTGATTGAGGSSGTGNQGDDGSSSNPVSVGLDIANAGSGSCDCGGDPGTDSSDSSSCGGDSSDSSGCDGGGSDGGCDGGGGDSCSGGGGGSCDCEIGAAHEGAPKKKHAPRLSILMMLGLALAAPLRRRARKNAEKKLKKGYLRTK